MENQVKTSESHIEFHLKANIKHLIDACEKYESDETQVILIAFNLRKLLSDKLSTLKQYLQIKKRSFKEVLFFDSANVYTENNIFGCFALLEYFIANNSQIYTDENRIIISTSTPIIQPKCIIKAYQKQSNTGNLISFSDWWEKNLILRSKDGKYNFTRLGLIKCAANKDSVHVDSHLPESYYELISGAFAGDGSISFGFNDNPRVIVSHTIRQIAEEVLETLARCTPPLIGKLPKNLM